MKIDNRMTLAFCFGAACFFAAPTTGKAVAIDIANPGFEIDFGPDGYYHAGVGGPLTGWTSSDVSQANYGDPPETHLTGYAGDGNQVGWINPGNQFFSQDLVAGGSPVLIAANQVYSITMDMIRRKDSNPATDSPVIVRIRETGTSTIIASGTYDIATQSLDSTTNQLFTLNVGVAPIGIGSQARLEIMLFDDFTGLSPAQAMIDNVTASVELIPEPASIAMIGLGLLSCLQRRKQRIR